MRRLLAAAIATPALLAACGGGGSDALDSVGQQLVTVAAAKAWTSMVGDAGTWEATGTDSAGRPHKGTFSSTRRANTLDPKTGNAVQSTVFDVKLANDTETEQFNWNFLHEPNTGRIVNGGTANGKCAEVGGFALPGNTARVDDEGSLAVVTVYEQCLTGAPMIANFTVSWSIGWSGFMPMLCQRYTLWSMPGTRLATFKVCVDMSPGGVLGLGSKSSRMEFQLTNGAAVQLGG